MKKSTSKSTILRRGQQIKDSKTNVLEGTYDFMQLYKQYIKDSKSTKLAKRDALDWLKKEGSFPKVNTSSDIRRYKGRLEPGKIYTFKYDPKTKDKLAYYDKNPLILGLGPSRRTKNLDLGINLNFLPPKYKLKLLDIVFKAQKSKIKKSRKRYNKVIDSGKTPNPIKDEYSMNFWYKIAKRFVPKELAWAIRSYYVNRRTTTNVISYNKWPQVAVLEISDMEGITLSQVYRLWVKEAKRQKK